MTAALRTTGQAPLGVSFCARNGTASAAHGISAHTSGVDQPTGGDDIYDHDMLWDFGDPASGDFVDVGRKPEDGSLLSKNAGRGHAVAHVFESPGTYTVRLRVVTPAGVRKDYDQQIIVSADTKTRHYYSPTGNDANDGLSEGQARQTHGQFLTDIAANGNDHEYLFERGGSWTWAKGDGHTLTQSGVHIGEYGTGAKPIWIKTDSGTPNIPFITVDTPGSDFRLVDMDLEKPSGSALQYCIASSNDDNISDVLLLRSDFKGGFMALHMGNVFTDPGDELGWAHHGVIIQEATIPYASHNGIWYSGIYNAIMGCTIGVKTGDLLGEHCIRSIWSRDSYINANTLQYPGGSKLCLKLFNSRGESDGVPGATNWNTISDNYMAGHHFCCVLGPQNQDYPEDIENNCLERNHMKHSGRGTPTSAQGCQINGPGNVARHNVYDGTGATGFVRAIDVVKTTNGPVPNDCRIYGNTAWKGDTVAMGNKTVSAIRIDDGTGHVIKNNLVSADAIGNTIANDGYTDTSNIALSTGDADFEDTTVAAFADYPAMIDVRIQMTSVAKDHASAVVTAANRQGLLGVDRPQGGVMDMGSFEYPVGDDLWPPPISPAVGAVEADMGGIRSAMSMIDLGT